MKPRRKTALVTAGALVAAGTLVAGCTPQTVYGPPPGRPEPTPSFHAENNIPAPVYGPPEILLPTFSPEENIPEDVYGPPMPYEEEAVAEEELPAEEPDEAAHEDS